MHNTINIRTADVEDAEALLRIYAPYVENTAVSLEYIVPAPEEFRERIRNTLKKYPYYVAEVNGEIVGYAYAGPFHPRAAFAWSVETSIYVKRTMHGMGAGRALYEKLESTLKAMGVLNLNASIACPQGEEDEYVTRDSERFHAHMGYTKVAEFHKCGFKFNRWYNLIWMEKMIGGHTEEHLPIEAFTDHC